MSNRIGTLHMTGESGSPLDLHVFDDAIVAIGASKAHRAGYAFGAIGGMTSVLTANAQAKKRHAQVTSAESDTAQAIAAAVDGATLFPLGEIAGARMEKAILGTRKLIFTFTNGRPRTIKFGPKQQSPDEVARVLGTALGGRFVDATRA
ncbi:MAG TPA: hypothetical protein VEM41_06625 [Actinomycetota bacterium]|nr:hypothetical protein [Actinomycetota bacterium]